MRKLYAIREVTSGMWLSTLKMRGFTSNFGATDSFFNTETNAYAAMHKLHTQIIKKGTMFRLDATWCKIYDDEQDAKEQLNIRALLISMGLPANCIERIDGRIFLSYTNL